MKLFIWFCFYFLMFSSSGYSQKNYTISGYIKEYGSGETMIGANLYLISNPATGTVSNSYGFYSFTLPEGEHRLLFSYLGYASEQINFNLQQDTIFDVFLKPGIYMQEVEITAENPRNNIESTEMGTIDISMETIKKLPALLGEVDLIKILQLLPGVSSATEGTAGIYVRGGGPDQNLVLLDEAIVYNTGHLLGFFSVFNSDAIKNSILIKGNMPANYGGRISSVIDVQMKEGNNQDYVAEGGVGLISSRFTVQGPLQKYKSSFILSGRRTYALDLAQPFISKTKFAGTNYYFYDLNAKVNYQLGSKDRIFISGYFGRDVFKFANEERGFKVELPYGNATGTFRWNHILQDNLFLNVSLIANDYHFGLHGGQEAFQFNIDSGVRDYSVKTDLDYYPNPTHQIKTGFRYTYHRLSPNVINATNGEVTFSTKFEPKFGHETEVYVMDDWAVRSGIKINAGVRISMFNHVGPYVSSSNQVVYNSGELVKTYVVPEPRIGMNFNVSQSASIKGGVSLSSQYIHLVSNSGSTLPADVWVPSTELVKPQIGIQYALGYYRNFMDNAIEASIETYYKDLRNQLDYKENYVENFSAEIENEFVSGKGRAYGLELFIRKNKGRLTGWIGYTLSKTERWFEAIEQGRVYPAVYDRPHDLVCVFNYSLSRNWQVSGNFIYATGRSYTPIKSVFFIDARPNIEYGPRNSARLEDYHRMDLSFIYENVEKLKKPFHSSWAFSIYNIYNRKNPFFTYTDFESNVFTGNASAKALKVSVFTIIPSVTWNFYWNIKK
ncbi:MAG: TonB-dependent receptor [Saprospiraceae bacterium]|nr:TonB-dependent receptor [Saprospiraceae bacterium]